VRWAENQRMRFIERYLGTFGHLNRDDLCGEFGISIQQASKDIQTFMRLHPAAMRYNLSSKRYERR
jgi:hypothetical protein